MPTHRDHGPHGRHGHGGTHGNPEDLAAYVAKLEDPARAAWQKPDRVVAALGLRAGQTAGEIGGGPGYWSLRLARKVGRRGRVFAVDVEPRLLDVLRQRLVERKVGNVTPVLGLPEDPLLPAGSCDVVLLVNSYHHLPDGPAYLRRVALALGRRGRIVNVDFHRRETPVGPPVEQRVAREDFLAQARRAGLAPAGEHGFLPYQYCVTLRPRR